MTSGGDSAMKERAPPSSKIQLQLHASFGAMVTSRKTVMIRFWVSGNHSATFAKSRSVAVSLLSPKRICVVPQLNCAFCFRHSWLRRSLPRDSKVPTALVFRDT